MKKKKLVKIFLAVVLGSIAIYNVPTMAKYITDKIASNFLKTKSFYFTSDLLSDRNASYQIGTWSGVGPFNVSFNIYSKDNELLFSDSDITFTVSVTCPNDVICSLNKTSGTLYKNDITHQDNIVISVSPQRVFLPDETLTITAVVNSTSPYEKELTGEFNYKVAKEGVSYSIDDESGRTYLFLKVVNDIDYCTVREAFGSYSVGDNLSDTQYRALSPTDRGKCISKILNVSFNPQDVLLDNTSDIIADSTYTTTVINGTSYINSISYKLAPASAFQIKFYKTDMLANNSSTILTNDSIVRVTITE